jgi:outer membrane protein assembly factor BamE (lipoprotein component of BamABCDE complex)
MELRFPTPFAILGATLVAGCAAVGLARLEPGRSTEADVRQVLGEPARTFVNADGSRQLAFPRGPEGLQTYMAFVAPDGRLVRVAQVLTEERLARISPGQTTTEELERLVGPPWRRIDFPNKNAVAWDYVFRDTWDYTVDFAVMVGRDGIVTEKVYARRSRGDSGFNAK